MSLIAAVRTEESSDVLGSLQALCADRGLADLGARLADLGELVLWDMQDIAGDLDGLELGPSHVHQSARVLLERGGKRLRPMCVALGARVGSGFSPAAKELGVAVEMVHAATLLHDDVVDLGDQRRGAPAARTIYGNAASIFAGDWLLIEALRRVRLARVPETLDRLLDIIDEMIMAESIQLENRGRVDTSMEDYFKVVEGKTAALFRWAMFAGAQAGGLDPAQAAALEGFGLHLGIAFQLVDDVLDYDGDPETTGKALFTDLREGKMTYPLLVARERDPRVPTLLEEMVATEVPTREAQRELLGRLHETGALDDCRALAAEHADRAANKLARFEDTRARAALLTVASATVHREK